VCEGTSIGGGGLKVWCVTCLLSDDAEKFLFSSSTAERKRCKKHGMCYWRILLRHTHTPLDHPIHVPIRLQIRAGGFLAALTGYLPVCGWGWAFSFEWLVGVSFLLLFCKFLWRV